MTVLRVSRTAHGHSQVAEQKEQDANAGPGQEDASLLQKGCFFVKGVFFFRVSGGGFRISKGLGSGSTGFSLLLSKEGFRTLRFSGSQFGTWRCQGLR